MRDQANVNDLFEGAYLLIRGFELEDLTVRANRGRKVVTFILKGEGVSTASQDYRNGKATANVRLLKTTVDHLKDLMFNHIRKDELHQHVRATLRDQGEKHHAQAHQA